MYAVYHGSEGLQRIARRVHSSTLALKDRLESMGYKIVNHTFFDTLTIDTSNVGGADKVHKAALQNGINFRRVDGTLVGVTLDESVLSRDLLDISNVFAVAAGAPLFGEDSLKLPSGSAVSTEFQRTSQFLTQPVFNTHHSETEMLRYLYSLQAKDLSLCHSMIPLGSCTMKLNSTTSMVPLSWKEFATIHPFVPTDQAQGYAQIIKASVSRWYSWLFLT